MTYLENYCTEIQCSLDQRDVRQRFSMGIYCEHEHGNIFVQMILDGLGKKTVVVDFQWLNSVYGVKIKHHRDLQKLLEMTREHIYEQVQGIDPLECVILFKNLNTIAHKHWYPFKLFLSQGYKIEDADGNDFYLPVLLTTSKQFFDLEYHFTQRRCIYVADWHIAKNKALISNLASFQKKMKLEKKNLKPMLPENSGDNLLIFYRDHVQSIHTQQTEHNQVVEAEKMAA